MPNRAKRTDDSLLPPLKFKVAPHIVEDLGLSLYTSLPRVLVEFVANAYDADSSMVNITLNSSAIERARKVMRKEYELEKAKKEGTSEKTKPLETRSLPANLKITIEDAGCGMSRADIDNKFLVAGRRRRQEEPESKGRTPSGRLLMGRKGLGKLAGFGVAKLIEVASRRKGESHATKITLDYEYLVKKRGTHEIEVPDERLGTGGGFSKSGTRVVLSHLLYDPLKSRPQTIEQDISEHFAMIDPADFVIKLNGKPLKPFERNFAYAWPSPEVSFPEFVEHSLQREGGGEIKFRYRIRFTGKDEALPASERGVRVYARKRLAASPSLLGADTNMHGFRMTDYLDGVVHADFIEEEDADYIATNRQALRWESPLLSGLYDFLSVEIKEACKAYQALRDQQAKEVVKSDSFTVAEIERHQFSKRDRRLAVRFAAILEGACKRGVHDPDYKEKLPILLRGLGQGSILTAITTLAAKDRPDLNQVAVEVARLTADELDQFVGSIKIRLKAIEALNKVVLGVDFKKKKQNEKVVQKIFEKSPWLIDVTYTQFLTANQTLDSLIKRLAKELKVAEFAPPGAENIEDRPDLVFLIGNESLKRVVIVELKSPNTPLEDKHLSQLEYYMETAESWLNQHDHQDVVVRGQLIGSKASPTSRARGVIVLGRRNKEAGADTKWKVRDFMEVLEQTEAAHMELIEVQRRAEVASEEDDD